MELFKWTSEYELGLANIDSDHRALFNLVNEVYAALRQGKARDMLAEIVGRLAEYARTHFRREEFYFRTSSYPLMAPHKAEHEEFIRRVEHYQQELAKGNNTFTLEVVGFLRDWLVKHIKGSDRQYESHLKKYGVR